MKIEIEEHERDTLTAALELAEEIDRSNGFIELADEYRELREKIVRDTYSMQAARREVERGN